MAAQTVGGESPTREGSGALQARTHLREEANEKWAGVLGEKLRGLSRGLLPVAERGGSLGLGWVAIPSDFLIPKTGCRQQPFSLRSQSVSGPRPLLCGPAFRRYLGHRVRPVPSG